MNAYPQGVKEESAQAGVEYAFNPHVDSFAASTETGFKHRETSLHAEHQEGCNQRPAGVQWVDDRVLGHVRQITRHQPA